MAYMEKNILELQMVSIKGLLPLPLLGLINISKVSIPWFRLEGTYPPYKSTIFYNNANSY